MLENCRYFTIKAKQIQIEIYRIFWKCYLADGMFLGHDTDFILAGFCIETFDGRKWQRQNYFSLIFWILAQFLNLIELLILPFRREGRISRLWKPKLSHPGACLLTNTQHVTLKSPKIARMLINNQIIEQWMFCAGTKDIFADFSKSPK